MQRLVCCAFHGPESGTPLKARDFFSTGTEIGGMACRTRASLGSYIADSDPESQRDHPMNGTAAAEQSVQEKEEEEELVDDGDDKNEATL